MANLQVASGLSSTGQYVTDGTNNSPLSLTDQTTGIVGIGLTAGETPLHVCGPITISNNGSETAWITNKGYSKFYNTNSGGTYPFDSNGNLVIQPRTSSTRDIVFATGSTTPSARLVVKSSGSIGIGTTSPASTMEVSGSIGVKVVSETSNYSAADETVILVNATDYYTVTLPQAGTVIGRIYIIKKTDSGNKPVYVSPAANEYIDGSSSSQVISAAYGCLQVVAGAASNWYIIGAK